MQSWFAWPNAQSHNPSKEMHKILLFEPKFQRKNENQGVLKSMKKVQNTNIRKWDFKEEKIKPIPLKPIYILVVAQSKAIVPLKTWRDITKVGERNRESVSE